MTRLLRCAVVLATLAIAMLAATPSAQAADYGPWFPAPGAFGKENPKLYRADVQPFSDSSVKEIANFSCVGPRGAPIPNRDTEALGGIFKDATDAYYGRLKNADDNKSGYQPAGAPAMRKFLLDSQRLVREGGWVRYRTREKQPTINLDYWNKKYRERQAKLQKLEAEQAKLEAFIRANPQTANREQSGGAFGNVNPVKKYSENGRKINDLRTDENSVLGAKPELASLIDPNESRPIEIAKKVPEGCGTNPLSTEGNSLNFLDIVTNTEGFFSDLIISIVAKPVQESYNFLQPYAFVYTFWTPHTERGDTIFNTATGCTRGAGGNLANSSADVRSACANGKPLGFDKRRLTDKKGKVPWFISAAIFIQWLVSGFYFILLFAAAVMYMVRGNKNTQMNVLTLIPKLILSALLTIFAPFLIGALISFSNVFVTSLFDFDQARSVGRINDILAQSDSYVTVAGDFIGRLIKIMVGAFTVFFFLVFLVGTLLRQLALMALVVLAPLACFCLLVPKWQGQFGRYIRALLAIIFAPAAMAFILKLGMSLNPVVVSQGDVSDFAGFIGLMLMLVTLWAMTKALRMAGSVATGKPMGSLTGKALGALGMAAGAAAVAGTGGTAAPLLGAAGKGLLAGSAASAAGDAVAGKLIPGGRGMSAGAALPSLGGGKGGGLGLPAAGASGFGAALAGAGLAPQTTSRKSMGERYADFLDKKVNERGEQRVSQNMAGHYRAQAASALAEEEDRLGRPMTRQEKDEFMNGEVTGRDRLGRKERAENGYIHEHGELKERSGNYFLATPAGAGASTQAAAAADAAGDNPWAAGAPPTQAVAPRPEPTPARMAAPAAPAAAPLAAAPTASPAAAQAAAQPNRYAPSAAPSASAPAASASGSGSPSASGPTPTGGQSPTCPRCGGPTMGGKCANPACSPAPRRRKAADVSDDVIEAAMADPQQTSKT